jgi:hypothetical protein
MAGRPGRLALLPKPPIFLAVLESPRLDEKA